MPAGDTRLVQLPVLFAPGQINFNLRKRIEQPLPIR
jgi:hypothetical protein